MLAAHDGHEGVVKLLLSHPEIQVNMVEEDGWVALMLAAENGHEKIVEHLLAHPGIHVEMANAHGSTALLLAAQGGHSAVVGRLLATGLCDINRYDNDTDTAVKMAAKEGHEAVVSLLLDTPHVDITIRSTADGHTALSAAQANGRDGIVQLFQDFADIASAVGVNMLSVHDSPGEHGSDSDPLESYFDAEEDWGGRCCSQLAFRSAYRVPCGSFTQYFIL
jgi:ankyrin repeat protein